MVVNLLSANDVVFFAQYIALLRKCNMRQRLATARRAMQQIFPLTEGIWLEWLTDEQQHIKRPEDSSEVQRLYDLAVNDYLSLRIWEEYLK